MKTIAKLQYKTNKTMLDFSEFNDWERRKVLYIMNEANNFGLEVTRRTQLGVNLSTGNTWVWDEIWPVCLYMPINCELQVSDIWACWTNYKNGEEHESQLSDFQNLHEMCQWVEQLEETLYDE